MAVKCNLILSGGGARGYAHVGVVRAILESGIQIKAISAASSGALLGAFICDGFSPHEIEEIILKHEPQLKFNYTGFWDNLLTFNSFSDILKKNLRSKHLEDLKIPLHVSVTNLNNGRCEILNKGNLVNVLSASSAIPVLLAPVIINNIPYADGGMSNNLPIEPFNLKSEKVIASHVNPIPDYDENLNMIQNMDRSIHIIMRNNILNAIDKCDLFIEPPALKKYHLFESKVAKELIEIGYSFSKNEIDLSILNKNQ